MKKLKLERGLFYRNPQLVKFIIVHCSATPCGRDIGAAEIRQCHLDRGFKDIGYHFVIRLDGTIETGRPLGDSGAHCLGKNSTSIGICYVGGVEKDCKTPADTRTEAQKRALEELLGELLRLFPKAEIRGHRDFAAKACPSFDATHEYRNFSKYFLVGILAVVPFLASCGTKKATVAEYTETELAVKNEIACMRATSVSDSLEIVLERPMIEFVAKDSTKISMTAQRMLARRKKDENTNDLLTMTEHDTVTAVKERAKEEVKKTTSPGKFFRGLIGLACVGAATLMVSRFLSKGT